MPVVTVRNLQRAVRVDLPLLLRQSIAFRNALNDGAFADHDLTVNLVSNSNMRRLNARYARADYVTDVLSFRPADAPPDPEHASVCVPQLADLAALLPPDLGTIFLAVPLCTRRAARRALPTNHYLVAATAHAAAHLAGHVHDDVDSHAAMHAEELRLLRAAAAVTRPRSHAGCVPSLPRSYLSSRLGGDDGHSDGHRVLTTKCATRPGSAG